MYSELLWQSLRLFLPRFISGLSTDEVKFLKDVAMKVVAKQQSRFVVSPWCLMAVLLAQEPAGFSLNLLIQRMEFFRDLLSSFQVAVDWPSERKRAICSVQANPVSHKSSVCRPATDICEKFLRVIPKIIIF